ncbi:MAG: phosphate ABC transporter permease subunit PstC [Candidatus Aureabacteria bacterium]|nr:phosphate ABC transporter permease subunit PstC [Candidatus Auribacterota bacterium]
MNLHAKETWYRRLFAVTAFSTLIFLAGIIVTLFHGAWPLFREVNVIDFLAGRAWYPTHTPPEWGILPLIAGTMTVTAGAMLISVPLGVGSALYLYEIAGKEKHFIKPLIEILAGIPSVVYGFFGMAVAAPFIRNFLDLPVGLCAFTASLILGIMAVPFICSLTEDALRMVPKSFREASLALGASRWQTLVKVIVPAAGSGISTAVILGMSRIIGETMTVLMISGGAAVIPKSIFSPVRPMTSTIAAEMGEAAMGSLHYHALFGIGLVLFLMTLLLNITAEFISRRFRLKLGLTQ